MAAPEKPIQLPDPAALKTFVEAAGQLELGIDPGAPPLVGALQEQLGVQLFERGEAGPKLTASGRALLPAARAACLAVERCAAVARGTEPEAPGELVIGTRHELGLSWLLPQLPSLRQRFPGVTFHLYFGSGPDLEHQVAARRIDCAITSREPHDPELGGPMIHREEYVFVTSAECAARHPVRVPSDVRHHTLIDAARDLPLFGYLRDALDGIGGSAFRGVVHVGTIAAVRQLVIEGEGVGVLPEYLVREDVRSRKLVLLLSHVRPRSDHFRLLHRVDDPRSAFLEQVAAEMRRHPLK